MINNPGRGLPIEHLPEHTLMPMSQFVGGPPIIGCFLCKECFELGFGQPGLIQPGLCQVFENTTQGTTVFSLPGQ